MPLQAKEAVAGERDLIEQFSQANENWGRVNCCMQDDCIRWSVRDSWRFSSFGWTLVLISSVCSFAGAFFCVSAAPCLVPTNALVWIWNCKCKGRRVLGSSIPLVLIICPYYIPITPYVLQPVTALRHLWRRSRCPLQIRLLGCWRLWKPWQISDWKLNDHCDSGFDKVQIWAPGIPSKSPRVAGKECGVGTLPRMKQSSSMHWTHGTAIRKQGLVVSNKLNIWDTVAFLCISILLCFVKPAMLPGTRP